MIDAFDGCFADTLNTRLIKGDEEPLYLPSGFPFHVSCDNINGYCEYDRILFQRQVHAQVMLNLENGVVPRPAAFIQALHRYYQTPPLAQQQFPLPSELNE